MINPGEAAQDTGSEVRGAARTSSGMAGGHGTDHGGAAESEMATMLRRQTARTLWLLSLLGLLGAWLVVAPPPSATATPARRPPAWPTSPPRRCSS